MIGDGDPEKRGKMSRKVRQAMMPHGLMIYSLQKNEVASGAAGILSDCIAWLPNLLHGDDEGISWLDTVFWVERLPRLLMVPRREEFMLPPQVSALFPPTSSFTCP